MGNFDFSNLIISAQTGPICINDLWVVIEIGKVLKVSQNIHTSLAPVPGVQSLQEFNHYKLQVFLLFLGF